MKEKIITIIQLAIASFKNAMNYVDTKISVFIPNAKIKKILYIAVGSFFGIIFIIITLGLLLSPFRNNSQNSVYVPKKADVILSSPEPQKELSATQKNLLDLEIRIKNLKFPEDKLNTPVILKDLKIN